MEKFTSFCSTAVPIALNDVDTDMIIPAQYLTSVTREGYAEGLFRRQRDENPDFELNQPGYAGSRILIAGWNFGCGSSREHAVWALAGAGFRAVIAKSFADIFFNNSAKNGLLLIVLPEEIVDRLLAETRGGGYEIAVDLSEQRVTLPSGEALSFPYDPFAKHCLLEGLDDIDYILAAKSEIEQFRSRQAEHRYFSTVAGPQPGAGN